jgi:hypothetical protein
MSLREVSKTKSIDFGLEKTGSLHLVHVGGLSPSKPKDMFGCAKIYEEKKYFFGP